MSNEKQPTIEQTSRFSAKTKQGQDVEFEAKLKFFVSPSGDVRISTPGGEGQGTRTRGQDQDPSGEQRRDRTEPQEPAGGGRGGGGSRTDLAVQPRSETRPERRPSEEFGRSRSREDRREFRRDPELDRGYHRAPPDECPIAQFVPDPCRALSDISKSFRSWMDGIFPDRKCPPPPPPREVASGEERQMENREAETVSMSKQDQFEV